MRNLHECPKNVPIEDWRWFLLWIQANGFVTQGLTPACDLREDLIWDQLDYVTLSRDAGDWLDTVVYEWDFEDCRTVADLLIQIGKLRNRAGNS
jgi:acyl carrier protein